MGRGKRDTERIRMQEEKDYNITKDIMETLWCDWTTSFTPMPEFSPSDMRFTAKKDGKLDRHFNVEIKSRNQDMSKYDSFPLTARKLKRLKKDTQPDERLIYVVLLNDSEYFIYDLYMVDWDDVELRDWRIRKQEYTIDGSDYEVTPTYFIPSYQAIKHGSYANNQQT